MIVTDGDLRPVWRAQAEFNPSVSPIDVHFGIRGIEEDIVVREEPCVAIVPVAKLGVASLNVAEIRLRQLHSDVVIVEIPERVTVDRKEHVFTHGTFKVQIRSEEQTSEFQSL